MPDMIHKSTACPTGIPLHLWSGLQHYMCEGRQTGHFLEAVLSNDLFEAFARADDLSRLALPTIIKYIYNHCPASSYGSKEAVEVWLDGGYKAYSRFADNHPAA